jgi:hypothetical protein
MTRRAELSPLGIDEDAWSRESIGCHGFTAAAVRSTIRLPPQAG